MPPKQDPKLPAATPAPKKRKEHPNSSGQDRVLRRRDPKRAKLSDARTILAQPSDAALQNGELNMGSFLRAREFEIKAMQDGMLKSKQSSSRRAFQQVPRDMRRRTASHNVKRVPKRLQKRAAREMKDDNTPTVDPSKRKPSTSRGRIRAETAKRLGLLASKKRSVQAKKVGEAGIETRAARPKIRRNILNDPPKPISKFRKRQIHKTWLPTHMWLAKRAKLTEPKHPLWRFAIPVTSTQKSYRPTHRAGGVRGAVAWDMSYMSTIKLEGTPSSLEKTLKAMGVQEKSLWGETIAGTKWRHGKRSWSGWLSREVEKKSIPIAPATLLWCPTKAEDLGEDSTNPPPNAFPHKVFLRIHPSAFLETWTELLRLSKIQRPIVHIEDLRFEIGSIEITGPGSTESLLGILHPFSLPNGGQEDHGKTFKSLAGVTNPGSLPSNAIMSFNVMDPRLRYPPRPVPLPDRNDETKTFAQLEMLSEWPVDATMGSSALFDRDTRFKGTRLPAQKSLNRRKALAPPGEYAPMKDADPPIPIMLLASRASSSQAQGTWTLLAPWKCILPIWYGLVHYPLSTGGNPRFGGLQELRQTYYEHGVPWFPADYPGTDAGFAWEEEQRLIRKAEWDSKPRGKRVEWNSLDLGAGRKGEIGKGWACDFEHLVGVIPSITGDTLMTGSEPEKATQDQVEVAKRGTEHLPKSFFSSLLSSKTSDLPEATCISTIRITLVGRGIVTPCARIYRLPQSHPPSESLETETSSLFQVSSREQWLVMLPNDSKSKLSASKAKAAQKIGRIPLNTPLPQRIRLLAQSLLQDPPLKYPIDGEMDEKYPLVPDKEDLIGFVTTGEFNLAEGKGVAVGSVFVNKAVEGQRRGKRGEGRLCIVRNAGEKVGWLGRWEPV